MCPSKHSWAQTNENLSVGFSYKFLILFVYSFQWKGVWISLRFFNLSEEKRWKKLFYNFLKIHSLNDNCLNTKIKYFHIFTQIKLRGKPNKFYSLKQKSVSRSFMEMSFSVTSSLKLSTILSSQGVDVAKNHRKLSKELDR